MGILYQLSQVAEMFICIRESSLLSSNYVQLSRPNNSGVNINSVVICLSMLWCVCVHVLWYDLGIWWYTHCLLNIDMLWWLLCRLGENVTIDTLLSAVLSQNSVKLTFGVCVCVFVCVCLCVVCVCVCVCTHQIWISV